MLTKSRLAENRSNSQVAQDIYSAARRKEKELVARFWKKVIEAELKAAPVERCSSKHIQNIELTRIKPANLG